MIPAHEVNAYCAGHGRRPDGVWPTRLKSKHVATIKTGRATLAHIPTETFLVPTTGQPKLAARFLCGSGSPAVRPVEPIDYDHCPRCREIDEHGTNLWAVYAFKDARGAYLYIGQTGRFQTRLAEHRKADWFEHVASTEILSRHPDRLTALAAERQAIRTLNPRLNIFHNPRSAA